MKKQNMDIQTILILIMIGLVAGILGGLVGIGGGIIIVPSLVYFLHFTQYQAQGTSLALLMLPVGILGVMNYYKNGHVQINHVLFIAAGFVLGSFFGSKISLNTSQETVKKIFAVFMLLIALKMLFIDKPKTKTAEPTTKVQH